jgi:hypothetical protein
MIEYMKTLEQFQRQEDILKERFVTFAKSMPDRSGTLEEIACSFFSLLGYDRNEMYLNFLISVKEHLYANVVIGSVRNLEKAYLVTICSTPRSWEEVKKLYIQSIPSEAIFILFSRVRIGVKFKDLDKVYEVKTASEKELLDLYNILTYWSRV